MPYFAVYETATGRLKSLGTVLADPLPVGLTVLDIGSPPPDNEMWDATITSFIPRPPKVFIDRLEDLKNKPQFKTVWQTLNAQQKDSIKTALIWLLGKARFRGENQPEPIE